MSCVAHLCPRGVRFTRRMPCVACPTPDTANTGASRSRELTVPAQAFPRVPQLGTLRTTNVVRRAR
eukprot:4550214-Alexandrium_andersonii.AAC.1